MKKRCDESFSFTPEVELETETIVSSTSTSTSNAGAATGTVVTGKLIGNCHNQVYSTCSDGFSECDADVYGECDAEKQIRFLHGELLAILNNDEYSDQPTAGSSSVNSEKRAEVVLSKLQYNDLFRSLQLKLQQKQFITPPVNDAPNMDMCTSPSSSPAEISPLASDLLGKQHNHLNILHKCLGLCLKYAPFTCDNV